jgi:ribulose-5-phosphate 4-epimerase/fuculose-1-phosphate aldolase
MQSNAPIIAAMSRLKEVIALLPELLGSGLLDAGGGSLAVRDAAGIYVTPTQASRELRWKLGADDFVLFPGGGEASMSRGARQPSRENRLHRAVLGARPDWNCTYLGASWGLLAYALAEEPLQVPEAYAWPLGRGKSVEVPVQPAYFTGELSDKVTELLGRSFAKHDLGAVIIGGLGPLIAGTEVNVVFALAQTLENIARARLLATR